MTFVLKSSLAITSHFLVIYVYDVYEVYQNRQKNLILIVLEDLKL